MPVILTTPAEVDRWREADTPTRWLCSGLCPTIALRIAAKGEKEDKAPSSRCDPHLHHVRRFDAIKATLPVGSAAFEPQRIAQGGYFIWIERSWLNKLEALRQPGEGLSETIIRLVAMEAGGRPGRGGAELFGSITRNRGA